LGANARRPQLIPFIRMTKPRVIVASASFDERSNYQEVVCARALARLGYDVLVVAALVSAGEGATERPYRIARVGKFIRVRDTIFAPRGLGSIVEEFKPGVAFLFGPNHGLPYALEKHLPASCKVAPVFGDLRESHVIRADRWLSRRGNPVIKRLLKDRWYRKLLKRADLVLASTNETVRLLEEVDADRVKHQGFMCGLAVDPSDFFFDPALRDPTNDLKTLVTVTRIDPLKPVEQWIQPVLHWLRENPGWRYILGGLPSGTEGERIRALIEAPDIGERFRILGRLTASEINRVYNNADLAISYVAGIGIQQSMVTGLPVLLPSHGSVDHLVEPRINGLYYQSLDEIPSCLNEAAAIPWDRAAVAHRNARLSATRLFAEIMERLGCQD
jgi:glycosyltransferase involved in cell wall biosynthesis